MKHGPPQSTTQKQKFVNPHITDFNLKCVKIILRNFFYQGPSLKWQFQGILEFLLREGIGIHPPSTDEGLRDIGHKMGMVLDRFVGVNSVTVLFLIRYYTLLQIKTDIITKCDSHFITECNKSFLQNASGLLLQNATVI